MSGTVSKAMILAAGFGTRLGDVGTRTPKCLMRAGGKAMIEHVIERLKSVGVTSIVINLHHLGDQIRDFVESQNQFGLEVQFSIETEILGTGGGILHAREKLAGVDTFIVHNGDVYSDLDLGAAVQLHRERKAMATLVVQERPGTRPLLFSASDRLAGWQNRNTGEREVIGAEHAKAYGFSGIQILSSEIFQHLSQRSGTFSSISTYLDAARAGALIQPYVHPGYWIDVGTQEKLAELDRRLGC